MTTKTIKLIAFIALLVHGIGHFQGVVASFGIKINSANASQSWLLKGFSPQINNRICLVLFLITALMGIGTALSFKGILFAESAWLIMAVITAFFSATCLILFPNGFAMFFNKAGAIAVNLIIFYSILLHNNWPTVLFEE